MKRELIALTLLALASGTPAVAQTVFYDDFDGDALLPHWFQPPASSWEYNVSDSMLNVTGLFSPSNPKSPSNFASMTALFPQQTDFQMDVVMGWEAGDQPHRLEVQIAGPFGGSPIIARMGYRLDETFGPDPVIFANAGGQSTSMPAPEPGIHHFTISRTAAQFHFFFNGSPFATVPDNFSTPAAAVRFFFLGPYPGDFGNFHIDSVIVVPVPGTILLTITGLLLIARPRRR